LLCNPSAIFTRAKSQVPKANWNRVS